MGTNYYAVRKEPCVYDRSIHLGKSSAGWLFLFEEHEEIHTFPQFVKWLEDNVDTGEWVLFDEYNKQITKEELLDLIEYKQNDPRCKRNPDNFNYNVKNIDGYRFTQGEFS